MAASVRVNRQQKNIMREQLEKIVETHKELSNKMESYQKITEVDAYKYFWSELETRNQETIQKIARFMVMKCNR